MIFFAPIGDNKSCGVSADNSFINRREKMKRKFFAIAATAVICLLFTTAYAYNAVDGSKWVESIKADTESKKVTITFSDDFINN